MFVCNQITTIIWYTFSITHFILFNNFSLCIFNLLFNINYIITHYYIHFSRLLFWRWQKKFGTCRRNATCLYIIVYNYNAVVGVYEDIGLQWNKSLSYSDKLYMHMFLLGSGIRWKICNSESHMLSRRCVRYFPCALLDAPSVAASTDGFGYSNHFLPDSKNAFTENLTFGAHASEQCKGMEKEVQKSAILA